jgi:hypothetical protein
MTNRNRHLTRNELPGRSYNIVNGRSDLEMAFHEKGRI